MNRDIIGSLYKLRADYNSKDFYEIILIIGLHPTWNERIIVEAYSKDEIVNFDLTFKDLHYNYERVG